VGCGVGCGDEGCCGCGCGCGCAGDGIRYAFGEKRAALLASDGGISIVETDGGPAGYIAPSVI
jgi:hypothetical protein